MVFHMRKRRKTKTHGHSSASEFWHRSMARQMWINLAWKCSWCYDTVREQSLLYDMLQSGFQIQAQAVDNMLFLFFCDRDA